MIFVAAIGDRTRRIEITGAAASWRVSIDGRPVQVSVASTAAGTMHLLVDGQGHELGIVEEAPGYRVTSAAGSWLVAVDTGAAAGAGVPRKAAAGPAPIRAPMPGKIVRVLVADGAAVGAGAGLLVIEAMKMENEIRSPRAGIVTSVAVREGQAVETGAVLCVLE